MEEVKRDLANELYESFKQDESKENPDSVKPSNGEGVVSSSPVFKLSPSVRRRFANFAFSIQKTALCSGLSRDEIAACADVLKAFDGEIELTEEAIEMLLSEIVKRVPAAAQLFDEKLITLASLLFFIKERKNLMDEKLLVFREDKEQALRMAQNGG